MRWRTRNAREEVGDRRHAPMREQLLRLALAAVVVVVLWPDLAPGQGAPIPLLPPTVTTPATPYQPAPVPYQPAPAAPPYQSAPPPPVPYQSAPAGQDQSTQSYQEAPAAPPPEQLAPIIATPLAPPPSPAPQSPNATPTAPTASAPPPSAPTGSAPPASTAGASSPAAPGASAPPAQASGQEGQTNPPEQPVGPEAAPPQYPNAWVPETEARLVVLNKIDSLRKDLTVKVGQSASYGALTITVQSCLVRPPSQPGDATAFLVISDSQKDEPGFRGWSLADEPWLSTLQNPVYDVWVVGCQS
jgi:hypothetical protein